MGCNESRLEEEVEIAKLKQSLDQTKSLVNKNVAQVGLIASELKEIRNDMRSSNWQLGDELKNKFSESRNSDESTLKDVSRDITTSILTLRDEVETTKQQIQSTAEQVHALSQLQGKDTLRDPDVVRWTDVKAVPIQVLEPLTSLNLFTVPSSPFYEDVETSRAVPVIPVRTMSEPKEKIEPQTSRPRKSDVAKTIPAPTEVVERGNTMNPTTPVGAEPKVAAALGSKMMQKLSFRISPAKEGSLGMVLNQASDKLLANGDLTARLIVRRFTEMPEGELNPAVVAGLREGDIIEEVNGQTGPTVRELTSFLHQPVGGVVTVAVVRLPSKYTRDVVPVVHPKHPLFDHPELAKAPIPTWQSHLASVEAVHSQVSRGGGGGGRVEPTRPSAAAAATPATPAAAPFTNSASTSAAPASVNSLSASAPGASAPSASAPGASAPSVSASATVPNASAALTAAAAEEAAGAADDIEEDGGAFFRQPRAVDEDVQTYPFKLYVKAGSDGLGIIVHKAEVKVLENGRKMARLHVKGFHEMPNGGTNPSLAAGMRQGDVIEAVNGMAAQNPKQLVSMLKQAHSAAVMITVLRKEPV